MARNNCARPGSDTEANVQTAKHAKVRDWAPKSGKQYTKALEKIRQQQNHTYDSKNRNMKQINQ